MGKLLDREFQKDLLSRLSSGYPQPVLAEGLPGAGRQNLEVNAHYLQEHGLITIREKPAGAGGGLHSATITARGLDFLAEDGGLGAILGVAVIRFETATLRAMVEGKIEEARLPDAEKQRLRARLSWLGNDALKAFMHRLVSRGTDALLEHGAESLDALF